jgi:hypothetical protein
MVFSLVIVSKVIGLGLMGKNHREIPLVSQGKRNHNICDVRLEHTAEVMEDYRVE